jgi:hypothetical protein
MGRNPLMSRNVLTFVHISRKNQCSRCAYAPDIRVGCKLHVDLHERFVGGYDWLTGDFDTLAFVHVFRKTYLILFRM